MRPTFFVSMALLLAVTGGLAWRFPFLWLVFGVLVALTLLGVYDVTQNRRAVLRNFPVVGHFRYLFELIRPEINQYFIESNTDGTPFNRVLITFEVELTEGLPDTVSSPAASIQSDQETAS